MNKLCFPLESPSSHPAVLPGAQLSAAMTPELLTHLARSWEYSKDGNKFPTVRQVNIPMQHIYLCDTTNPFFLIEKQRGLHTVV